MAMIYWLFIKCSYSEYLVRTHSNDFDVFIYAKLIKIHFIFTHGVLKKSRFYMYAIVDLLTRWCININCPFFILVTLRCWAMFKRFSSLHSCIRKKHTVYGVGGFYSSKLAQSNPVTQYAFPSWLLSFSHSVTLLLSYFLCLSVLLL